MRVNTYEENFSCIFSVDIFPRRKRTPGPFIRLIFSLDFWHLYLTIECTLKILRSKRNRNRDNKAKKMVRHINEYDTHLYHVINILMANSLRDGGCIHNKLVNINRCDRFGPKFVHRIQYRC